MFEEIFDDLSDTFEDVKKGNGKTILLIGGVVILFFILLRNRGTSDTSEVVYTYSSYPSAERNAEVIIDSLYDSLQYSEQNIMDKIDENFVATNDYINEGLKKQEDLANKIYDETMTNFNNLSTNISNISQKVDNVDKTVDKINTTVNTTSKNVSSIKETVSKSGTTSKTAVTNKNTTSYLKTSYKGNSIVDALKSIGVNSSYSYRQKLAKANGITNYKGTASQNTTLLNKLKQGTLIKA